MTHNQVTWWNNKLNREVDRSIRERQNEIAQQNANTNRFAAEREDYWTHRQKNFEDSKFGYTMFKDFMTLGMLSLFG